MPVGPTVKIGTIQRRLAWPLRKDDTLNREVSHFLESNLIELRTVDNDIFSLKKKLKN